MKYRKTQILTIIITLILAVLGCSINPLTNEQAPAEPEALEETSPPEPSPEPTATTPPTPTAAEESTSPQGACANSLMPLQVGNQWTYEQTTSEGIYQFTWEVTEVTEEQATFKMTAEEPVMEATYSVKCEENAVLSFPNMGMGITLGDGTIEGSASFSYQHNSGVFLPAPETLRENDWEYAWETEILLSGEAVSSQGGEEFQVTLEESPWILSWEAQGLDPLTIPVGDYPEAVKVSRNSSMTMISNFEGQTMEMNITTLETQWYKPGIGMLKSQTEETSMNMSGVTIDVPQESTQTITTLVEFTSGSE
jgi:hypothetical protein